MYMNLAISLLVDLGLDKETPDAIKADAAVTSTDLIDGDHFSAAARRTFLGCYYMSSAYVTRHRFEGKDSDCRVVLMHSSQASREASASLTIVIIETG